MGFADPRDYCLNQIEPIRRGYFRRALAQGRKNDYEPEDDVEECVEGPPGPVSHLNYEHSRDEPPRPHSSERDRVSMHGREIV